FPGGPARVNRRALALALLTGVFTAGYSLVNKLGVALVPVPLYALLVFAVDATLISLARWLHGWLAGTRVRDAPWGRTIVVGVLMMAAYLAVLAAMAQAPVSYVVAAREVSVVVAAILGALVLRERHPAGRMAGAAVIFAGLVGIALADWRRLPAHVASPTVCENEPGGARRCRRSSRSTSRRTRSRARSTSARSAACRAVSPT